MDLHREIVLTMKAYVTLRAYHNLRREYCAIAQLCDEE